MYTWYADKVDHVSNSPDALIMFCQNGVLSGLAGSESFVKHKKKFIIKPKNFFFVFVFQKIISL